MRDLELGHKMLTYTILPTLIVSNFKLLLIMICVELSAHILSGLEFRNSFTLTRPKAFLFLDNITYYVNIFIFQYVN